MSVYQPSPAQEANTMQSEELKILLDEYFQLGVEAGWEGNPEAQRKADEVRRKIEAALSTDAEPVAIYKGNGLVDCGDSGHHNIELLKLIAANTPLYAAPPAPSVAVNDPQKVEALIAEVHDAIDEYREGMKGDKFGPHEWPTVDGIKTTVAQSLRRSALSAQVQDVADLPQDVIDLVITAREFWGDRNYMSAESDALDKALEKFASRVPYEEDIEDPASKHGDEE